MSTLEEVIFNLKAQNIACEPTRNGGSRNAKYAMVGMQVTDMVEYISSMVVHPDFDNSWITELDKCIKTMSALDCLSYKHQTNLERLKDTIRGLFGTSLIIVPKVTTTP